MIKTKLHWNSQENTIKSVAKLWKGLFQPGCSVANDYLSTLILYQECQGNQFMCAKLSNWNIQAYTEPTKFLYFSFLLNIKIQEIKNYFTFGKCSLDNTYA